MKLYGARIFVDDIEAARQFYTEVLGLPLAWNMPDHGVFGVKAGTPELIIEAAPDDDEARQMVGRFAGLSLEVADIAETYQALVEKGVAFVSPPERQFWGGELAHFKDPSGNVLTLLGKPDD